MAGCAVAQAALGKAAQEGQDEGRTRDGRLVAVLPAAAVAAAAVVPRRLDARVEPAAVDLVLLVDVVVVPHRGE